MSGFSSQWLDAREPVDHAARSEEILSAVSHYFLNDPEIRITDIGCGTGSTIRALKPFFSQTLSWHLVDNDDALLDRARENLKGDSMVFSLADLSQSLDVLFEDKTDLITTSAFLDLVSRDWLESFCQEVVERNIPFYAALTYDGRSGCEPKHPLDEMVMALFNEHQKTDKGFGPALGPDAAETAIRLFQDAGYIITQSQSDWIGQKEHRLFQKMLLEGWCEAACEIAPDKKTSIENWLSDRLNFIDEKRASVFVGHVDFFAVPA